MSEHLTDAGGCLVFCLYPGTSGLLRERCITSTRGAGYRSASGLVVSTPTVGAQLPTHHCAVPINLLSIVARVFRKWNSAGASLLRGQVKIAYTVARVSRHARSKACATTYFRHLPFLACSQLARRKRADVRTSHGHSRIVHEGILPVDTAII